MVAGHGITYRSSASGTILAAHYGTQVVELDGVAEFDSYIRGYHAY